jgi:hypothetical protein
MFSFHYIIGCNIGVHILAVAIISLGWSMIIIRHPLHDLLPRNPNGGSGTDKVDLLVEWPKFSTGTDASSKIFVIKPTPTLVHEFLPKESSAFWSDLIQKYGRKDGHPAN